MFLLFRQSNLLLFVLLCLFDQGITVLFDLLHESVPAWSGLIDLQQKPLAVHRSAFEGFRSQPIAQHSFPAPPRVTCPGFPICQ